MGLKWKTSFTNASPRPLCSWEPNDAHFPRWHRAYCSAPEQLVPQPFPAGNPKGSEHPLLRVPLSLELSSQTGCLSRASPVPLGASHQLEIIERVHPHTCHDELKTPEEVIKRRRGSQCESDCKGSKRKRQCFQEILFHTHTSFPPPSLLGQLELKGSAAGMRQTLPVEPVASW